MLPGSSVLAGSLGYQPLGQDTLDYIVLGLVNPMFLDSDLGDVDTTAIPYWTITKTDAGGASTFQSVADTAYPGGRTLKHVATTTGDKVELLGTEVTVQPYAYLTPTFVLGVDRTGAAAGSTIKYTFDFQFYREDGTLTRTVSNTVTYDSTNGTFGPIQKTFPVVQMAANERKMVPRVQIERLVAAGTSPTAYLGLAAGYDAAGDEQLGILTALNFGANGTAAIDLRLDRENAGVLRLSNGDVAGTGRLDIQASAGQQTQLAMLIAGELPRVDLRGGSGFTGLKLGPGGASSQDVGVLRTAIGELTVSSNGASANSVEVIQATAGQSAYLLLRVAGDSNNRISLDTSVTGLRLGDGTVLDLRAYRSAAKVFTIDDTAGGNVTVNALGTLQQSGTGVSLIGHGAADHANITRRVVLRAIDAGVDGGTAGTHGVSPSIIPHVALANAATQGCYWLCDIPLDWDSGVITAQVVWAPAAADATPHTVRWTYTARVIRDALAEFNAPATTTFTGASAARVQDQTVFDTATSTAQTPNAGDLFRIEVQRIGADAADTYTGTVNLEAVILTYTANQ